MRRRLNIGGALRVCRAALPPTLSAAYSLSCMALEDRIIGFVAATFKRTLISMKVSLVNFYKG